MIIYYGELIGTFFYIFIGLSIVFLTVFEKESIGKKMLIAIGWALAYFIPSIAFGEVSGPHLNPMITISLVAIRKFESRFMWGYMIMQIVGSVLGTLLFYVINRKKLKKIKQIQAIEVFCIQDEDRIKNFFNEFLASFFTVFSILSIAQVFGITVEIIYLYVIIIMFVVGIVFDYRTVSTNPIRYIFPQILYKLVFCKKNQTKKEINKSIFILQIVLHIAVPIIAAVLAALAYKYLPWDSAMLHK